MSVKTCYISCNCNHTPTVVHWDKNDLICYGSCNAVLIYNPKCGSGGSVVNTLIGHTKRVNSVRWIRGCGEETELVSGSADGTAIVWSLVKGDYKSLVLKGHESNVNIVDGIHKKTQTVVVTISMDSSMKIWRRLEQHGDFCQAQNVDFGYNISVGIRMGFLPNSDELILACAMDNSKINLYTEQTNAQFTHNATLEGHEDWVRGLDFTNDENDLLLASASQDMFIRLWRITSNDLSATKPEVAKMASRGVYLEAILSCHEGWVYSVDWNPNGRQLLSASLDKTMIIWEFDQATGVWLDKVRVGEVGGNTLGFYGGVFGPHGNSILGHGYHGAFHLWDYEKSTDSWMPAVTVGGHFNEVVDLAWEPDGQFLFTISTDQTTRVHAPWTKNTEDMITWHEIARPQVHGYDLSSIAVISRHKFASSAEEKVIRVFQAPNNFVENFHRIYKACDKIMDYTGPTGASVPSLGLSNKAIYEDNNNEQASAKDSKDPYPQESHFTAVHLEEPPTEETLLQNTLWPETHKLYGHGYEVYSLAASPDGRYLASACKATTVEHSAIILWDTTLWNQLQTLRSHTLTVVQITFSPDSNHLLSVSRDRRWSLFTRSQTTGKFDLSATTDKKTSIHTRIIWCCAWTHDSKYFATGSRDGKVVVWTKNVDKPPEGVLGQYEATSSVLELKNESFTAVAFAPDFINGNYVIACGLESGIVMLHRWNTGGFYLLCKLDQKIAHHLCVKRLCFRPVFGKAGHKNCDKNILQLASCSSDYSVRIFDVNIKDF